MQASKFDIRSGLRAFKKMAELAFAKADDERAVHFINAYLSTASQFNLNYTDDGIEALFKQLADRNLTISEEWTPNTDRWVLYDDFCTTYVLGLQWLEAMASSGKEILYITTRDISKENRHRNIMEEVSKYENVTPVVIPQGKVLTRAQDLYNVISEFKPSKIVLHKYPTHSLSEYVLPVLPQGVKTYLINLSDQTYWTGAKSIDYCLEFRPFGSSVSLQRRGLKEDQLLMVPYYPANDNNVFQGFPVEKDDDRVIIFSGGDYYKTLDKDRTYWILVRELLTLSPQIVFIFATKNIPEGDSEIRKFIADNHFENRFYYIAFRPDIYQVFAHCDIFMGTCPTSGALMSQLAAINSKPILQYYAPGTPDDETEQAICINDTFSISHHEKSAFFKEAERLILDPDYRKNQGARLKTAMMQQSQFNELVVNTLETNQSMIPIKSFDIDYSGLDNRWYYLEKAGYTHVLPYIYSLLGAKNCFKYATSVFLKKNLNRLVSKFTDK